MAGSADPPLVFAVPDPQVTPTSVAHINEEGTVLITDNEAGNTRAIREAEQGLHGWAPP